MPDPAVTFLQTLQSALNQAAVATPAQTGVLRAMAPFANALLGLERLFALSHELLCVAGAEGAFRKVNPAFERALGYTATELVSRPFFDFVHPNDVELTRAKLEKLLAGLDVILFENRYRKKDGSYVRLSWTCPAPPPGSDLIYAMARVVEG